MKKFVVLVAMALMLVSGQALASDKLGIYVTPKLTYGIEVLKGKASGVDVERDGSSMPFSDSLGSHNKGVFGGGLAIGYDFSKKFDVPIRTELEYMMFSDAKENRTLYGYDPNGNFEGYGENSGTASVQSLFLNVYYDFRNESKFVPYIGGGIGLGFVGLKGSGAWSDGTGYYPTNISKKNSTNFAWNLGLGCAYEFTDYFALDLSYRYANFGKGKSGTYSDEGGTFKLTTSRIGMHQFTLGARFTF